MPKEKYVVIHDGFVLTAWKDFMREEKYVDVVLDTHQYLMMAEAAGCEQTIEGYTCFVKEHYEKKLRRWRNISRLSVESGVCSILLHADVTQKAVRVC